MRKITLLNKNYNIFYTDNIQYVEIYKGNKVLIREVLESKPLSKHFTIFLLKEFS